MIDETTLSRILESITILTALTYFALWFDRHHLKGWQESVGSIVAIVYTIAMMVRLALLVLA